MKPKTALIILLICFIVSLVIIVYCWNETIKEFAQPFPSITPAPIVKETPKDFLPRMVQGKVREVKENEMTLDVGGKLMRFRVMETTIFYAADPLKKGPGPLLGGTKNLKVNQEVTIIYKIISSNLFLAETIWL